MIPKFRAWSKDKEILAEVVSIDFWSENTVTEYFRERDFDDIVLMRSTGLFDKNGKEIFEGDIITDGFKIREIKNHQTLGFYMLDEERNENFLSDTASIEDFEEDAKIVSEILEIIGNVYENPELLEVTE